MGLKENIENREDLISSIEQELVGPIKVNPTNMLPLDISDPTFKNIEDTYEKYYNSENLEEILQVNTPLIQYSSGILFPYGSEKEPLLDQEKNIFQKEEDTPASITDEGLKNIESLINRSGGESTENQEDSVELMPQKNDFSPASLGLSYFVELCEDSNVCIKLNGGVYKKFTPIMANGRRLRDWWSRDPVESDLIKLSKEQIYNNKRIFFSLTIKGLDLRLLIINRNMGDNRFLMTVSLTNETEVLKNQPLDQYCLFQSQISIMVAPKSGALFLPYPTINPSTESMYLDEDKQSNDLLYREAKTFALGHGCSANWSKVENSKQIDEIFSTFLPEYESMSMTPDIVDEEGNEFSVSMLELASPLSDSIESILGKLVSSYENWIELRQQEVYSLKENYGATPQKHIDKCRESAERMRMGIEYIKKDDHVYTAFKMANHAMAIQQKVGNSIRKGKVENDNIIFNPELVSFEIPKLEDFEEFEGNWRAFQIAFFLLSIPSVADGKSLDRETVDLIWFPTGGGKTEAYLGVAAFSMFLRRLRNKNDTGTDLIMRYTLRLLTTDQFQRSSRLICSMEMIRRKYRNHLGETPFSIGIWLGSKTTPNQNEGAYGAKEQLKQWKEGNDKKAFIVKSCPWCGASLGKYTIKKETSYMNSGGLALRRRKNKNTNVSSKIFGYEYSTKDKELKIKCPDKNCSFHKELPIYIVDETIYEKKPTFIIGTIDKFAMLSWKPEARSIFGLNMNGERELSPPNLIIQDELHLISGPLGSLTGMYEVLIEELSTDYRKKSPVKPKIICSTATISHYEDQILSLYGRDKNNSKIFPSPGLSHDDSFFARIALEDDQSPSRGRKYLGVYSPTIGMQMLQVKIYSILLQKVMEFRDEEKDPFWTLLSFFNSIRELGGALTLLQTDVPSYLNQIRKKHNIKDKKLTRWLNSFLELTSRLDSGEVTQVIDQLKVRYGTDNIDVCLASNIIEVGVDIDRLSLMTVVGQPKNTAQYIQVTGRIGRKWKERPGLVVTLYKSGISRDKSHFEHFREYHEKLYTKVEPTSVTPFSDPCISRGLYGLIIGYLRQLHGEDIAYSPENIGNYVEPLNEFKTKLLNRVRKVDTQQVDLVEKSFDDCVRRITKLGAKHWEQKEDGGYFLMYQSGSYIPSMYKETARPVPMSMRSVDAPCHGEVSNSYLVEELE
ncbi:helicase-related protein [Halobacillus andaensis]|uniref:helicase-related protein n=1 Tax=Halobacillus andaensis TaxID=1176239 RepID=UPI003D76170C